MVANAPAIKVVPQYVHTPRMTPSRSAAGQIVSGYKPLTQVRQLPSLSKTPIQGIERRGNPQKGRKKLSSGHKYNLYWASRQLEIKIPGRLIIFCVTANKLISIGSRSVRESQVTSTVFVEQGIICGTASSG